MPEIRLVKKYPHIKDEDVTSIFQEGYIKGFENGRKDAIPIEWLLKARNTYMIHDCPMSACAINEIINLWHICSEEQGEQGKEK